MLAEEGEGRGGEQTTAISLTNASRCWRKDDLGRGAAD